MSSRGLILLAAGSIVLSLLAGGFIAGVLRFESGDPEGGRPVMGGPLGLQLAEGRVTVVPRAVRGDRGQNSEAVPEGAEPLSSVEVGVAANTGNAIGTLDGIDCVGDRMLRMVAEGSAYFIEISPSAPWDCQGLIARWRPLTGAGQRVGIRYQERTEAQPGYVTLLGEGGSLLFAASGMWVAS